MKVNFSYSDRVTIITHKTLLSKQGIIKGNYTVKFNLREVDVLI
jgi:hypothetical protein